MDESDAFLVARAIRRDKDAFSRLYIRYVDQLYRFIRPRVNTPADAEDLLSNVFLNAWRWIDRFSPKHDGSFLAWLYTLAHNLLIDRYRRHRDEVSLDALEPLFHNESAMQTDGELETRLTMMDLQQALTSLTTEQRNVVCMRFLQGFSAREVGDFMGKRENAVRVLQFRALDALRRALGLVREGDTLA
jgi:RNA polymerase sigma-70 factor, ECF subfamily